MKILAMEIEVEDVRPEQYGPHLKAEAQRIWELYKSGSLAFKIISLIP
jgi:hypothetical protein